MNETRKKRRRELEKRFAPAAILGASVLIVVVVSLLPVRKKEVKKTVVPPVNVTVEKVTVIASMPEKFRLDGSVEANRVVKVAAEVPGRIERFGEVRTPRTAGGTEVCMLEEGDRVKAGAVLMYLNTDLLKAARNLAKADYEYKVRDYRRIADGMKRNVSTKRDLDEALTAMAISKATLEEAQAKLDRAEIVSPVDGIVNRIPVEIGEYVQPGTTVAQIVDIDIVKVVVNIPEREIGYLRKNDEVKISSSIDDSLKLTGRITYISKIAEPLARTTRAEITVPNAERRLCAGQIVTVDLKRRDLQGVIMIPLQAVIALENGHMVNVARGGVVRSIKDIRIDMRSIVGDRIRVLPGSDLKAGDLLIVGGTRRCGPGQKVRIVGQAQPGSASAPSDPPVVKTRSTKTAGNPARRSKEGAN